MTDWIREAAKELEREWKAVDVVEATNIIQRFVPTPRCDTCAHRKPENHASSYGWCRALTIAIPVDNFGCVQWKEKSNVLGEV
jgi:hypothetical protein